MKRSIIKWIGVAVVVSMIVGFAAPNEGYAQLEEPDLTERGQTKTPLSEGFKNSLGFDAFVNNFGIGIGGQYSRVVGPYTQLTFRTGITGIRDVSEQNFQDFFTGQQIIPNKYKRAFGFPFLFGVKQRLFAENIDDSFRFFASAGVGPAMAFTYPYVRDNNNNGFRDFVAVPVGNGQTMLDRTERVNDFFTGWKNGETHWGFNGEIKIGVDLGSTFGSQTTIEFGYFFYYFKQGLQIMEPHKPYGYTEPSEDGPGFPIECVKDGSAAPCDIEGATRNSFNPAQKYFGTPQIKFTFGGMW